MDPQRYVLVPPSSLKPNPNDKRDRTTAAHREWVHSLSLDLKERGMRNPIQAMREADALVILAGMTRWQAALMAGLEKVPVNVLDRPLTEGEQLLEQLLENELRHSFSDLERAELYAALMDANDWSQAELARVLKISPANVSKVMAVSSKLPADIRAMIGTGDGKISPSAAYQLSRLTDPAMMRELGEKSARGLLDRDHLAIEVAKRLGKRAPKEKPLKVCLPGITLIIAVHDVAKVAALLGLVDGGLKKAERHGLPLSSLPQLLKGA